MKKHLKQITLLIGILMLSSSSSFAVDTKTFTVSASIPSATSVGINAFSINASTGVFTPVSGLALSFDPLVLEPVNQIYLPNHFFAIDVAPVGGAGTPNVTATYTEGLNPNAPNHGLGWKSTATFIKVTGATGSQTETGMVAHGPKKLLKDVSGESILNTEIFGGFLRIYVGIVTKDPAAAFPDPATGEVFTNSDDGGAYNGQLLISATIP